MRKHKPKPRVLAPDPRYNDTMVTRFVNHMMWEGKKSVAFSIFYDALDIVKSRTNEDELQVWKKALNNVMPQVEVRSRRVGGANYQVPMEVRPERRTSLAIRWLIDASRARTDRTMTKKLASEIIDAQDNKGGAIKMRDDVHKMAEANKAFAHYRW